MRCDLCGLPRCRLGTPGRHAGDDDPEEPYCETVSWKTVARIVSETDDLVEHHWEVVSRFEAWVRDKVAPRWAAGAPARRLLLPDEHEAVSRVVHRVTSADRHPPRLAVRPFHTPATPFVMMAPDRATAPAAAGDVWLSFNKPVRWVRTAARGGALAYRFDSAWRPVDTKALTPGSYGRTWARSEPPLARRPPFMTPEQARLVPEPRKVWYVWSPGVRGWMPVFWDAGWYQRLPGIRFPVLDVGEIRYGENAGVLIPPAEEGDLSREVTRLVRHPFLAEGWIPVYEDDDGRHYTYSFPADAEIDLDPSPRLYNRTWKWPPSLV